MHRHVVYAIAFNNLYRSTNGGQRWAALTHGDAFGTRATAFAVSQATPQIFYVANYEGLFSSQDDGRSWNNVSEQLQKSSTMFKVTTLEIDARNPTVLYAGLLKRGIFVTTNGGTRWEHISDGLPEADDVRVIAVDKKNVVYARLGLGNAPDEHWLGKRAGTESWIWRPCREADRACRVNAPLSTTLSDMESRQVAPVFAPRAPKIGYRIDGVLYKTTDGGKRWRPLRIELAEGVKLPHTLAVDPFVRDHILVGCKDGMLSSTTGGE